MGSSINYYPKPNPETPHLLQNGTEMINSNSPIVFLLPNVSQLQQRQDLAWTLLLGNTESKETNPHPRTLD